MSEVLEMRGNAQLLVGAGAREGRSTVRVGGVPIGPNTFTLIAGPCAVESPDQTLKTAMMARRNGAAILHGGAFQPRGDGLLILSGVRAEVGLPFVTEVLDTRDVDLAAVHADMLQVGARNMWNFALLREVGHVGLPVLLERGLAATVDEWLHAAEHIARAGTEDIVLCERGIRTFEVRRLSHLPVIVDPSHTACRRDLVLRQARAGADGLVVEIEGLPCP